MLASFDPIALDKACVDLCNAQPAAAGSIIDGKKDDDHFHATHPTTNWRSYFDHAVKMGLGTMEYELIKL